MTDKDIIVNLGGPAVVAVSLGYDKKKGGVQRVQNWMARGIPPKVRLENPHLFPMPPSAALQSAEQQSGDVHPQTNDTATLPD